MQVQDLVLESAERVAGKVMVTAQDCVEVEEQRCDRKEKANGQADVNVRMTRKGTVGDEGALVDSSAPFGNGSSEEDTADADILAPSALACRREPIAVAVVDIEQDIGTRTADTAVHGEMEVRECTEYGADVVGRAHCVEGLPVVPEISAGDGRS